MDAHKVLAHVGQTIEETSDDGFGVGLLQTMNARGNLGAAMALPVDLLRACTRVIGHDDAGNFIVEIANGQAESAIAACR